MNDAMAVDVAQAIENLTEQTPRAVYIIVQAVFDQITQCLYSESASKFQYMCCSTHVFLAILHLNVKRSEDGSTV